MYELDVQDPKYIQHMYVCIHINIDMCMCAQPLLQHGHLTGSTSQLTEYNETQNHPQPSIAPSIHDTWKQMNIHIPLHLQLVPVHVLILLLNVQSYDH